MQAILNFITGPLNTVAWMYCLLPCVFLGGLFFTVRHKGIQFTKFGHAMKNTIGKVFQKQKAGAGEVTPFQAMTTALAGTVGTGSIAGVTSAICLGGPGAVFWIWVCGVLGMATKYAETVLAVRFRVKTGDGCLGGPMYVMVCGLGERFRPLARCYAFFGVIAASGLRVLVERRVDYSKTANLVMTSVVMTIGLSGAKLSVGSVTVQCMVLATLIAMALSMMFKLFEHCGLMRKD